MFYIVIGDDAIANKKKSFDIAAICLVISSTT